MNNHSKWLPFVDTLHTAGHTRDSGQPTRNHCGRHSLTIRCCNRGKAITDVETPYEPCFNRNLRVGKDSPETSAPRVHLEINRPYGGGRINTIVEDGHAAVRFQDLVGCIVAV